MAEDGVLAAWDSAELQENIQRPLLLQVSPLQSVLTAFHDRMESMALHQAKLMNKLSALTERVGELASKPADDPTPAIDGDTKAMLASLQQFAQDVQECGGLQQIGTVAGLVDSCGGAENVDANLGLLREVTELAQGPQNLADSLTGMRETLTAAGSPSELVNLLQTVRAVSEEAGGPRECVDLLLSSKDLVSAAGGHHQLAAMLQSVHSLSGECGGAGALAGLLQTVSGLCATAGGAAPLAAMLQSSADLVTACGGATDAQAMLSQLAAVVTAAGGAQPFAGMLQQLQELAHSSGGTDALGSLFRDLTQVIAGAGGAEGLLERLLAERGAAVPQAPPPVDPNGAALAAQSEALAALKAKVAGLEEEVRGFNSTIEELRAAGRVEAMEDLMTNLLGELNSAEKARERADTEARAAQDQARSSRFQATQSLFGGAPAAASGTASALPGGAVSRSSSRRATAATPRSRGGGAQPGSPRGRGHTARFDVPELDVSTGAPPHHAEDTSRQGSARTWADSEAHERASGSGSSSPAAAQVLQRTNSGSGGASAVAPSLLTNTRSQNASPREPAGSAELAGGFAREAVGAGEEGASSSPNARPASPFSVAAGPSSVFPGAAAGLHPGSAGAAGVGRDDAAAASPAAAKPRRNVAGLFKAKAQEVVKEKRLGVMKRFASSALQSTINRVEKPVAEVLQKLTNFGQAAPPAATPQDIDELHERVDDALSRILGLDGSVAELREVKADKSTLAKLSQAIKDLWRAVQELQGPEGDEHRGVKQVHGKCISCDRPLKIVRDGRLAPGPPTLDAFGPGAPGSANAPGWEAGSKRALGNGAMETYWELMTASRRGGSPPKASKEDTSAPAPPKTDAKPARAHTAGRLPRVHQGRPATAPEPSAMPSTAALRKLDSARGKRLLQLQPTTVSVQSSQIRPGTAHSPQTCASGNAGVVSARSPSR